MTATAITAITATRTAIMELDSLSAIDERGREKNMHLVTEFGCLTYKGGVDRKFQKPENQGGERI